MALMKQRISIPFIQGMDTKSDDKQDEIGVFENLENVIFDTPKKLKKRPGYDALPTKDVNGNALTEFKYLSKFKSELCALTLEDFYSYSETLEVWTDKGNILSAIPSSTPVIRNNLAKSNPDSAVSSNIAIYSYQDSAGVKVTVKDLQNEHVLLNDFVIAAAGTLPRVANIESVAYVVYADGTNIKFKTVNLAKPSEVSAAITAASDLDATNKKFDVSSYGNKIFITYNSTGNVLKVVEVLSTNAIGTALAFAGEDARSCVNTTNDDLGRLIVIYANATAVKVLVLSYTLSAALLAATVVETIASVSNCAVNQRVLGTVDIFYEVSAASPKDSLVKNAVLDLSAMTVASPSSVSRSVGLASKSFSYNDKSYVFTVHSSTLQSTYFLMNSLGEVITKISPGISGGLVTSNVLPNVINLDTNIYLYSSIIKGRLVVESESFLSFDNINSTQIEFSEDVIRQSKMLGDIMHLSGGTLKMYDGNYVVEHGFNVFPEDLTAVSSSTTGGFLSDGERQYSAVYAWTDNQGNIHRSAPSVPLTVLLSGGGTTQSNVVRVPTLRITEKANIIIELYGTEDAGTVFYKVTTIAAPVFNVKTSDTIDITVTVADADLISNELLYTTGGVLENIIAPASKVIESFQNRLFLAGLEDENLIAYSKIRGEGSAAEFNDILTLPVNPEGDAITSLSKMDDKLVVFKKSAIFYVSGDGPNNIGQQNTFIEPQLVSSEIGCIDPNSVVLGPEGLFFKSAKGIYLLGRSLNLEYIGSNVEKFNAEVISSAQIVGTVNQVRFTTLNGSCLVYNYYTRRWAVFTNFQAKSALQLDEQYYYLRKDGTLFKEDANVFTDNGSYIPIKLETSWMSFAGVQGFQRIYKLMILGTFKTDHRIRVRVCYDFVDAPLDDVVISSSDFATFSTYGSSSPYGSEAYYGGTGNLYQFRVQLKRQKCQAVKFIIEELQSTVVGEGLSLSNIAIEVGVKQGLNKTDQGRNYGTE